MPLMGGATGRTGHKITRRSCWITCTRGCNSNAACAFSCWECVKAHGQLIQFCGPPARTPQPILWPTGPGVADLYSAADVCAKSVPWEPKFSAVNGDSTIAPRSSSEAVSCSEPGVVQPTTVPCPA